STPPSTPRSPPVASRWIFKMTKPRIAILTGYGINSDVDLAYSFNLAGGHAERVHLHDAIDRRVRLEDFSIVAIPGRLSFGDHTASGRVSATRLRYKLADTLLGLREKKVPILGICNGFQVLVKLGLLPGTEPASFTQTATLTYNDSGRFENRWCHLKTDANVTSPWLKGITQVYLPIRHGEGKFIDRKSTRLNSSHVKISYAVFCLKKKKRSYST